MMRLFFAIGALCLLIAGAVWMPATEAAPPVQTAQDVCIARWAWATEDDGSRDGFSFWQAPFVENNTGLLDLRSLPQMGQPGPIAEGWGLFAYNQPMGFTGMHCLGGDLDASLTAAQADTIALILGKLAGDIQARTPRTIIRELFLEEADPTGMQFWKPVRISPTNGLQVHLGGYGVIAQERFSLEHPAFANTLAVRKSDYDRNARAGVSLETLEKWTGRDMLAYHGRRGDDLLPLYVPQEYIDAGHRQREPATTITESFPNDAADLTAAAEDLDWTVVEGTIEVTSGAAENTNASGAASARAESDLSSDDHYSQVQASSVVGAITFVGVGARYSASAATYYSANHRNNTSNTYRLDKVVAGTITNLDVVSTTAPGAGAITTTLEVNGSALTYTSGGVERSTATDTDITGNLRTGIVSNSVGSGNRARWDDFEASDLAAGESQIIIIRGPERYAKWWEWPTMPVDSPAQARHRVHTP